MNWISIQDHQPGIGQRCIIWHSALRKAVFAYHVLPGIFDYPYSGDIERVGAIHWMPEPMLIEDDFKREGIE